MSSSNAARETRNDDGAETTDRNPSGKRRHHDAPGDLRRSDDGNGAHYGGCLKPPLRQERIEMVAERRENAGVDGKGHQQKPESGLGYHLPEGICRWRQGKPGRFRP